MAGRDRRLKAHPRVVAPAAFARRAYCTARAAHAKVREQRFGRTSMSRAAIFGSLLIATLCLSTGAGAAKNLPEVISLEDFTAFLKRAVGDKVDVKVGIGGFVANLGEVAIGWVGEKSEGKTGDALVIDAIGLMKIACDDATVKLSPVASQSLDGVRVLRQSFSCSIFGLIEQYSEAIIIEDGARFEAFYNGGPGKERAAIVKSGDGIVAALVAMYR
jgi:hypothetical protein